ncbi:dentin sialophosphoprotein-like [Patiria miniata]|uniref:E3 ubiquitin-protein ligase RNF25 n=1 Tax=Patiria miniata TaxID=46514 RepID=A0A913ZRT8_PATMI|nr:dentin sialophosphoprotein-like [Patiria miniata]
MAASMIARSTSECSEGSGTNDGELLQELGLLEAIYVHELDVNYTDSGIPTELSIILHPATAGNLDQQYVCLTLNIKLPEQYPHSLPEITIRNPRGVSDEHLASLGAKLNQIASERQGGAMLYELIEVAKESLTDNNTPSCQCVICLHGFTETDVFTKTQCYHYFHSQCLARYLKHAQENEEESVCPVCREPVICDLGQLEGAPPPNSIQEVYTPNQVLRDMQREMAALYRRQKEKGGIIDIEAENNKFLIHISQTPSLPANFGISPVIAQPQRSTVSQNDTSCKVPPTERESSNQTVSFVKPLANKDVGQYKGSRPGSSQRSDYKQGGRGSGRGQGSDGRGQRPYSSGARNYYSRNPGSLKGSMFNGKSSNEEASAKHTDSENTTDQSDSKTENVDAVDQSNATSENGPGKVLVERGNKDQRNWSGRQRKTGSDRRLKGEYHGKLGESTECSIKPNVDKTKDEKITKNNEKAESPVRANSENKSIKRNANVQEMEKTSASKTDIDKEKTAVDRDYSRSKGRGQDSSLESGHRSDGGRRPNRRPAGRSHAPRKEGGSPTVESERSKDSAQRKPDENLSEESGFHDNKQYTGSAKTSNHAKNSTPGNIRERESGRTRNRNRNRRREPGQFKDSLQSDNQGTVQGERSKFKGESEPNRRDLKGKDTDKTKSAATVEIGSREGRPRSDKSKLERTAPPGFGEPAQANKSDVEPKSVKPPPGFENVTL